MDGYDKEHGMKAHYQTTITLDAATAAALEQLAAGRSLSETIRQLIRDAANKQTAIHPVPKDRTKIP